MTRHPARTRCRAHSTARALAAFLAGALLAAGCGSAAPRGAAPARRTAPAPLATSLAAGAVTWAAVPMGAASGPNEFWQLFALPAGGRWALVTPPDVATNGAIALAPSAGRSLAAGIRPSLLLGFSPVTSTPDGGRSWSADSPESGLASVPDALAASPDGRHLIALTRSGTIQLAPVARSAVSGSGQSPGAGASGAAGTAEGGSSGASRGSGQGSGADPANVASTAQAGASEAGLGSGQAGWQTLVTSGGLAAGPGGRACGLRAGAREAAGQPAGLTAVAFSPSGVPEAGAACAKPGLAGVFADRAGSWQLDAPALPAALRGRQVRVLRLVRTGGRLTTLLLAGPAGAAGAGGTRSAAGAGAGGPGGSGGSGGAGGSGGGSSSGDMGSSGVLLAAWESGGRWTVSAPLRLAGPVRSSSAGAGGGVAVTLAGRRGFVLARPGAAWQATPPLPAGRAVVLALPASGGTDALTAAGNILTAWRLRAAGPDAAGRWQRVQTMKVPVQYGSSS